MIFKNIIPESKKTFKVFCFQEHLLNSAKMQIRRRTTGVTRHAEEGTSEMTPLLVSTVGKKDKATKLGEWIGAGGRCVNCLQYFKDAEDRETTPCAYHPGKYSNQGHQNCLSLWSCCSDYDEKAKGCFVGTYHKQCPVTLDAMRRIQFDTALAPQTSTGKDIVTERIEEAKSATEVGDVEEDDVVMKRDAHDAFWDHEYKKGETLMGIALAYGVSVGEIKRANKIMGDFLDPGRKFLLIPKKGGERPSVAPVEPRKPTRTALASNLCEKLSVKGYTLRREEASFYIDDADGDLDVALHAAIKDLDWERENPTLVPEPAGGDDGKGPMGELKDAISSIGKGLGFGRIFVK